MMWIVRHASTEWNRAGIKFGQLDPPLDTIGLNEAADIVPPNASIVVTSPLLRAYQTAEILAAKLGVPLIVKRDLIECSHGRAEGLHRLSRDVMFPDMQHVREPDVVVRTRVLRILRTLPADALVVTHKGVMRAINIDAAQHGQIVEWLSTT